MLGKIATTASGSKVGLQVLTLRESKDGLLYIIGVVEDIEKDTAKIKVLHTNDKSVEYHNQTHIFVAFQFLLTLIVKCDKRAYPLKHSQWNAAMLKGEVNTETSVKFELKTTSELTFAKIIPLKKTVFDEDDLEKAFNAGQQTLLQLLPYPKVRKKYPNFAKYKELVLQTE